MPRARPANSGPRWSIVGRAIAARTCRGTLVGPGIWRKCRPVGWAALIRHLRVQLARPGKRRLGPSRPAIPSGSPRPRDGPTASRAGPRSRWRSDSMTPRRRNTAFTPGRFEHAGEEQERHHAVVDVSRGFGVALAVAPEQPDVEFGYLRGGHRADGPTGELVHDEAAGCAAEDTAKGGRRGGEEAGHALTGREALFFHIFQRGHVADELEDLLHGQARSEGRRCVLQDHGTVGDRREGRQQLPHGLRARPARWRGERSLSQSASSLPRAARAPGIRRDRRRRVRRRRELGRTRARRAAPSGDAVPRPKGCRLRWRCRERPGRRRRLGD